MEENFEEYLTWCYINKIYFYAFTNGCADGFCRVSKWSNGVKQSGKKLFELATIGETILNLYREIYLKNNGNKIIAL